jgi:hypothetical protein
MLQSVLPLDYAKEGNKLLLLQFCGKNPETVTDVACIAASAFLGRS